MFHSAALRRAGVLHADGVVILFHLPPRECAEDPITPTISQPLSIRPNTPNDRLGRAGILRRSGP
jgi:hypothetical protein